MCDAHNKIAVVQLTRSPFRQRETAGMQKDGLFSAPVAIRSNSRTFDATEQFAIGKVHAAEQRHIECRVCEAIAWTTEKSTMKTKQTNEREKKKMART